MNTVHGRQSAVFMHDKHILEFHNQLAAQAFLLQHLLEVFIIVGGITDNTQVISYFQDVFYGLERIGFMIEKFKFICSQRTGEGGKGV